jgi:hypothetical protein
LETLVALEQIRRTHPAAFEPGSPQEREALERFAAFFSSLAPDRVQQHLDATYHPDVFFNDTLKSVRGRDVLRRYLLESAEAVESCLVSIEDTTRDDHGEYLIRWRMMIRFRRFRRGVDTWSIGISHLRFAADGRVVYHQDYWNAAEGLYQHLPLLGAAIRWVQRRL